MHLADFDEQLVSSRIWTDSDHIEQRLADLTQHMENVIQVYLRNEFDSILEYNAFAGEMAEPYRILVIANFPANFTETAVQRLKSIVASGARCGVFVLLGVDSTLTPPHNVRVSDLDAGALLLRWTPASRLRQTPARRRHCKETQARCLRYRRTRRRRRRHRRRRASSSGSIPNMGAAPVTLDSPPPPERFTEIVRAVGHEVRDAGRVEVPFRCVIPAEDAWWTSDSRSGIDVPLGRAGAMKLQNLDLGRGTSQHVLDLGQDGLRQVDAAARPDYQCGPPLQSRRGRIVPCRLQERRGVQGLLAAPVAARPRDRHRERAGVRPERIATPGRRIAAAAAISSAGWACRTSRGSATRSPTKSWPASY